MSDVGDYSDYRRYRGDGDRSPYDGERSERSERSRYSEQYRRSYDEDRPSSRAGPPGSETVSLELITERMSKTSQVTILRFSRT